MRVSCVPGTVLCFGLRPQVAFSPMRASWPDHILRVYVQSTLWFLQEERPAGGLEGGGLSGEG